MSTPDPRDRALDHLLRRQLPADAGAPDLCPDAETLAAWADGALEAGDVAALEAHAAGCARCQATMAVIIEGLEPEDPVERVRAGDAAAGTPVGATAPASRRGPMVRWVVPLTAAAAAVLLYVLAPGDRSGTPDQPESVQARAEETVAGEPPATLVEPTPGTATTSEARTRAPAAAPPPPAAPMAASPAARQPRDAEAAEPSEALAVKAEPAPPPPAPRVAAPAAFEAVAGVARRQNALPEAPITSTDDAVRWRFADARSVERSADGGVSWARLDTGAPDDLLAGAAPSALICWLVGRNGMVLRTVDGRTWQAATRPADDDLVAVEAGDAVTATVRTAGGRRFRTADGGATWEPTP